MKFLGWATGILRDQPYYAIFYGPFCSRKGTVSKTEIGGGLGMYQVLPLNQDILASARCEGLQHPAGGSPTKAFVTRGKITRLRIGG